MARCSYPLGGLHLNLWNQCTFSILQMLSSPYQVGYWISLWTLLVIWISWWVTSFHFYLSCWNLCHTILALVFTSRWCSIMLHLKCLACSKKMLMFSFNNCMRSFFWVLSSCIPIHTFTSSLKVISLFCDVG